MSKQGQIKVIVVGDSGVGKSSILLRFVNDEFNEFNDPTLGAAFLSKVHTYGNNQSVRLQVLLF
jgi:GTPase SAR1 family protein